MRGVFPAIAVIGDSTFTHSGMTGLLDAVNDHANITVVISDNLTTAMTGGQDSAGTNKFEAICLGLGVEPEHVRVVVPLPKNMEEITRTIREEIEYLKGLCILPHRECIGKLIGNGAKKPYRIYVPTTMETNIHQSRYQIQCLIHNSFLASAVPGTAYEPATTVRLTNRYLCIYIFILDSNNLSASLSYSESLLSAAWSATNIAYEAVVPKSARLRCNGAEESLCLQSPPCLHSATIWIFSSPA